jgi:hypothetical protein
VGPRSRSNNKTKNGTSNGWRPRLPTTLADVDAHLCRHDRPQAAPIECNQQAVEHFARSNTNLLLQRRMDSEPSGDRRQ